ncbi:MAG: hypothetical protein ACJZ8Q_00925 [Paracoccaceae bacterium]
MTSENTAPRQQSDASSHLSDRTGSSGMNIKMIRLSKKRKAGLKIRTTSELIL